jgi:glycolate oxidase FAD binding subunit
MIQATSVEQVQEFVRQQPRVVVRGGGTKAALSRHANLDLRGLSGVTEYDPGEYTITALAGTSLREVREQLLQHQQFLAFDPPLVEAGATLGGTIAAGLSGPGRFRYGGLRDFLLGVRLVNGVGEVVRGGGKVVKNAAGFDIARLTVGSLGRLGVLLEATFKVFPQPAAYQTLQLEYDRLESALDDLVRLAMAPIDASCLELLPPRRILIRLGGQSTALERRTERCLKLTSGTARRLSADEDQHIWQEAREFAWSPAGDYFFKIPLLPQQIAEWEAQLPPVELAPRRYGAGGHVLWLSWPDSPALAGQLQQLQRRRQPALMLRGAAPEFPTDPDLENVFAARLSAVFDPQNKFINAERAGAGAG